MTIVHARAPKRRRKAEAQAAPLPLGRIVTAKKPGSRHEEPEIIDPDAEARVKAWMKKQLRRPGA